MEAPRVKPHRTAQRDPGVVSLVMWAQPPAAVARSQGGGGAKMRDMRGAGEEELRREVGSPTHLTFMRAAYCPPFCWESGLTRVSRQPQGDDDDDARA